jgi:hypothetical protein
MTTTSECVEMYQLFTNSGLTPDEAAELVDGIAQLSREQKEVLSQKLVTQQKAWTDTLDNPDLSTKTAQANLLQASIVVGKGKNALLDELPTGTAVLAAKPVR